MISSTRVTIQTQSASQSLSRENVSESADWNVVQILECFSCFKVKRLEDKTKDWPFQDTVL